MRAGLIGHCGSFLAKSQRDSVDVTARAAALINESKGESRRAAADAAVAERGAFGVQDGAFC
jgi:hypothetical protein